MPIINPGQVTQRPEMYDIQLLLVENWVLAAICSAFGSGLLLLLYVKCTILVWNKQNQRSQGMRYFLLAYMTTLMALSLVQTIMISVLSVGSVRRFVAQVGKQYFPLEQTECSFCDTVEIIAQVCAAVVNWGMDGFMIWRCMVLYRDLPRLRRLALCTFAFALGGASLASGILFVMPSLAPGLVISANIPPSGWRPVAGTLSFFACVTLFINITFTALVSVRLWLHQSRLQKLLGPAYGSIYRRIVVILLESAAMVVVANIVLITLLFLFLPGSTAISCFVINIYAASPLIILYRIHNERDVASEISKFNVTRQLERCATERLRLEPLRFMASNPSSPEAVVSCIERPVHPEYSNWKPATIT